MSHTHTWHRTGYLNQQKCLDWAQRSTNSFARVTGTARRHNIIDRMIASIKQWGHMVLRQTPHLATTIDAFMPIMHFYGFPLYSGQVILACGKLPRPSAGSYCPKYHRVCYAIPSHVRIFFLSMVLAIDTVVCKAFVSATHPALHVNTSNYMLVCYTPYPRDLFAFWRCARGPLPFPLALLGFFRKALDILTTLFQQSVMIPCMASSVSDSSTFSIFLSLFQCPSIFTRRYFFPMSRMIRARLLKQFLFVFVVILLGISANSLYAVLGHCDLPSSRSVSERCEAMRLTYRTFGSDPSLAKRVYHSNYYSNNNLIYQ